MQYNLTSGDTCNIISQPELLDSSQRPSMVDDDDDDDDDDDNDNDNDNDSQST